MTEKTGFALDDNGELFMDPITKSLAILGNTGDTVRQRIATELSTFFSEYVLNQRKGLPYIPDILMKEADPRKTQALISSYLAKVEDVKRVLEVTVNLNASDRELKVFFRVSLSDGQVVQGGI